MSSWFHAVDSSKKEQVFNQIWDHVHDHIWKLSNKRNHEVLTTLQFDEMADHADEYTDAILDQMEEEMLNEL